MRPLKKRGVETRSGLSSKLVFKVHFMCFKEQDRSKKEVLKLDQIIQAKWFSKYMYLKGWDFSGKGVYGISQEKEC